MQDTLKSEVRAIRIEPKLNLQQIQDRFIEKVNAAAQRWGHRKLSWDRSGIGGHFGRSRGAAWKEAMRDILAWGFTKQQATEIIRDAEQMADLERNSEVE